MTELVEALLRGHAHLLASASFIAVVEAALSTACGFDAGDWAVLQQGTGRRGAPSEQTVAAVLDRLEGMLPRTAKEPQP